MNHPTRRGLLDNTMQSFAAMALLGTPSAAAQSSTAAQDDPGLKSPMLGRVAPEDFGAVGDGQTDDAAALQAAIAALERAGGGILVLGNRTYKLNRSIEIDPTKTSVSGARAVLDCRGRPPGGAAIVIRARAESSIYDQGTQFIEGVTILGPGAAVDGAAIALRTEAPGQSSRIALRNLVIKSVGVGIDFGARAYICQSYSVQIFDTGTGVAFTSSEDAGENISFYGCSIFNSGLAVDNRAGAYANFLGCSFDYCRRWFTGRGLNQFTNCWFEKHRPERSEDYPFDLISGELTFLGGGIQISGVDFSAGNQNRYMFMIRDRLARVNLHRVGAWNWRTASDELAGGAGTIVIEGLSGSGSKIIPTVVKNDPQHNVFGSGGQFQGSTIKIGSWIDGRGATRVGPNELEWGDGAAAAAKSTVTIEAQPGQPGRQGLRIIKGVGPGTEFFFNIATPIAPGEGFAIRLWCRVSGKSVGPIWFQIFFSQTIRTDGFGLPALGNELFWGETEVRSTEANGDWRKISFNSHNLNESSAALGYAPAWATHVRLSANLTSLASDNEFWINDLGGWRM
jgi:Pectate lyase superfamily protein